MEQLARTFKALADPTRLRIVNMLLRKPGCVCELQAVLNLPRWTASTTDCADSE